jgi:hypothetical protein
MVIGVASALTLTTSGVSADRSTWDDLNIVFRSIMGRPLDQGDYSFWKDEELTTALNAIPQSVEYEQVMRGYITDIYLTVLGRYPDSAGGESWVNAGPLEVYRSISSSEEAGMTSLYIHFGGSFSFDNCPVGGYVIENMQQLDVLAPADGQLREDIVAGANFQNEDELLSAFSTDDLYIICGGNQNEPSKVIIADTRYGPVSTTVEYTIYTAEELEAKNQSLEGTSLSPATVFRSPKEYSSSSNGIFKQVDVVKPVNFRYTESRYIDESCGFYPTAFCRGGLIIPHSSTVEE